MADAAEVLKGSASEGTIPKDGTFSGTDLTMPGEAGESASSTKRRIGRKPGQPWDGRLATITLEEYREKKWSMDACFNNTKRRARGPSYTMRVNPPQRSRSATNVLLSTDVAKALDKVRPAMPSWSMGATLIGGMNMERSQGPAQYAYRSTMETRTHPTIGPQNTGATFGSEKQHPDVKDARNPAPGDYSCENYQSLGRYKAFPKPTIQGRESWQEPTSAVMAPGVGEYKIDGKTRVGKDTPVRWTMQSKLELKNIGGTATIPKPGPNDYQETATAKQRIDASLPRTLPKWKFASETRGLV